MALLIRAPEGLQPSRTTRCSAHNTPMFDSSRGVHARIVLWLPVPIRRLVGPGCWRGLAEAPIKGASQVGFRACSFPACSWLSDYAGPDGSSHLAAPSARLEVKMVRYSFLVGLFHPRLHAGLSRRLHLLTRVACQPPPAQTRACGATAHGSYFGRALVGSVENRS
jgi:hypothetical protein